MKHLVQKAKKNNNRTDLTLVPGRSNQNELQAHPVYFRLIFLHFGKSHYKSLDLVFVLFCCFPSCCILEFIVRLFGLNLSSGVNNNNHPIWYGSLFGYCVSDLRDYFLMQSLLFLFSLNHLAYEKHRGLMAYSS